MKVWISARLSRLLKLSSAERGRTYAGPARIGLWHRLRFRVPSDTYFNRALNKQIIAGVKSRVFDHDELPNRTTMATSQELLRRAYGQHLCQQALHGSRVIHWLRNLLAAITLVPLIAFWLASYLWNRRNHSRTQKVSIIAFDHGQPHHRNLVNAAQLGSSALSLQSRRGELAPSDILFLLTLLQKLPSCFFHSWFLLKIVFGVSYYAFVIRRYSPRRILNFNEDFCGASVQTAYCRSKGVKNVNLMHGDRAFVAEYAFVTFDEFHVWGEHYRDLFSSLHGPHDQYVIAGNPIHKYLFHHIRGTLPSADDRACLLIFYETLLTPASPYLCLLVRLIGQVPPHWRLVVRIRAKRISEIDGSAEFTDTLNREVHKTHRRRIEIENEEKIAIQDSIASARAAVGIYSTALLDSWVAGRLILCLKPRNHTFCLPDAPYAQSRNVLVYDEEIEVRDFLKRNPCNDATEQALVQRVSFQGDEQH